MTDTTATHAALAYYARHNCALFPIPAGQKNPTGIVQSFVKDNSADPAQWDRWYTEHKCNFGIVAGPSRLIIIDIDTKEGRDEIWSTWCDLCASWGIPIAAPHTQSARGGWHVYFAVPADVDASTLRQPDAIKKLINVRAGNGFTVAAGSHFESLPYVLMSDAAPYPAPAALVAHCSRQAKTAASANHGTRDRGDVAALMTWLAERDAFTAYEDWLGAGMALKLEFGDTGFELWELTFDNTVTADVAASKWQSFASEPTPGVQTLSTWLDRAHKLGWRGTVRKSTAALFDGVAQIAAAAGASLPVHGAPGMPMLAGQEALADQGRPILLEFLAATTDAPTRPATTDFPTLPDTMSGHGLFNVMRDCIERVFSLTEVKPWKPDRINGPLSVLSVMHPDIFLAVQRRLNAAGFNTSDRKIRQFANNISEEVERITVSDDKWEYDVKNGEIQNDNPDNVRTFLGIIGIEIRWNDWLHCMEVRGGTNNELRWSDWTAIDDTIVAKLRMRAMRTKTRFKPGKEFFRDALDAFAHDNLHDPVVEYIDELQRKWDGTPRLAIWLSATCGLPCDLYHQAVGKNVIGGIVKRARSPGSKHDEVMILMGAQGTAKSTLCRMLALRDGWFTDSVSFDGSPQNIVPQLFGKLVVELSELDGMGRTEVQSVKRFISAQSDNVTLKYKAYSSDHARRCVFIGTSNEHAPLVDITGNRRFLPVRVNQEVNLAWLRANIEQMIGEAATLQAAGADFAIPREVWGIASEHQEAARQTSDVETMLSDWFAPGPYTGDVTYIYSIDVARLAQITGWRHGGATAARGAIMRKLGFKEENIFVGGQRKRLWARKPDNVRPADIPRLGLRYIVGVDTAGNPVVSPRKDTVPNFNS